MLLRPEARSFFEKAELTISFSLTLLVCVCVGSSPQLGGVQSEVLPASSKQSWEVISPQSCLAGIEAIKKCPNTQAGNSSISQFADTICIISSRRLRCVRVVRCFFLTPRFLFVNRRRSLREWGPAPQPAGACRATCWRSWCWTKPAPAPPTCPKWQCSASAWAAPVRIVCPLLFQNFGSSLRCPSRFLLLAALMAGRLNRRVLHSSRKTPWCVLVLVNMCKCRYLQEPKQRNHTWCFGPMFGKFGSTRALVSHNTLSRSGWDWTKWSDETTKFSKFIGNTWSLFHNMNTC